MGYNGYTEKKKISNQKYMEKIKKVSVWVTPEEKNIIEQKAQKENKSINQYIKDLIFNDEG
jgi:predicted HicB family RNase H-like nuclease